MTTAFALVRAAHLFSLMAIFGAEALKALFARRLRPPPASHVPDSVFHIAAAIAFVTAILWLLFTTAQVSGDARAVFDGKAIATVATQTSFGPFFTARIVACGFLLMAAYVHGAARARLFLSAFALADIAFTGHAAASGTAFGAALAGLPEWLGAWLGIASDTVHLLTAGFWIGALVELVPLAIANRSSPQMLVAPLRLFSAWATPAVALLIAAGALNGVMILYMDPAHWSATYLTLLAVKIVLAALMVGLALANRFSLLPGMRAGEAEAERNLIGSVIAELSTGAIIVVIVGFLGLAAPMNM